MDNYAQSPLTSTTPSLYKKTTLGKKLAKLIK
jgi:hypothetical protein